MTLPEDPLAVLGTWLQEAREAEAPAPAAMTLVTATTEGRPSARTVSLKRLEEELYEREEDGWRRSRLSP